MTSCLSSGSATSTSLSSKLAYVKDIDSLTLERLVQMVDYIVEEPNVLTDSLQRCYKLPFIATETLCTDIEHIKAALYEGVLDRLFTLVTYPEQQKSGRLTVPSSIN